MAKNRVALSFLFNATKPFKFYLGLHLFVIIYCAIDISLWPYVSKLLIDELSSTPRDQIIFEVWPTALLLVILTILPGLIWRISDYS
ncbi:MAG: hypothetical protein KGP29_04045 [Proteobacteria bacterium]|nr:hypothetical protein [Pseudomonadota bacterium]